jgi:hypothetical protein
MARITGTLAGRTVSLEAGMPGIETSRWDQQAPGLALGQPVEAGVQRGAARIWGIIRQLAASGLIALG